MCFIWDVVIEDSFLLEFEDKMVLGLEKNKGVFVDLFGSNVVEVEKLYFIVVDIVIKFIFDKFECVMCGFGLDFFDDYEFYKKIKVYRVIEELWKD